jgi:dihydrofolate synthase / folylpolyglutamate synthase
VSKYNSTLQFLFDLQLFGIKVGLQNITHLVDFLDHPERRYPCIHIAGTNGKGSTAAMLASILTASGYRTGLYTSPHLIDFTERIRIDGVKIRTEDVIRYTKQLKPLIEKHKATFFEATTAIAFQYFADQKIDVAVIETGLGGRLDATNIVNPILSIITNIGKDHTEHLGNSLSEIAYEKGGIIKYKTPCITGASETLGVFKEIAKNNRSPLIYVEKKSSIEIQDNSLQGLKVNLATNNNKYNDLIVSLSGEHQGRNLQVAILAAEYLITKGSFSRISKKTIHEGLNAIQKFTGLRGRLDAIKTSPLIIADVAHNPDGIKRLCSALQKMFTNKFVIIFGVMRDKHYVDMMNKLASIGRFFIVVRPDNPRALDVNVIVNILHNRKIRSISAQNVSAGIKLGISEIRQNEPILVTGSHYVVGEAMNFLKISV